MVCSRSWVGDLGAQGLAGHKDNCASADTPSIMSTASFKLKGQRLVGKWISIEFEEEGKPVWYKARVDTVRGQHCTVRGW